MVFRIAGASLRYVDTVEGIPSRGCVIPLRGGRKCDSGKRVFSDKVVERRQGRGFWRVRKHSLVESAVARPPA